MSEGNPSSNMDDDRSNAVIRHRNIFESNSTPPPSETGVGSDSSDNVDGSRRKISFAKGKPCIFGSKCRCICGHYHVVTDYYAKTSHDAPETTNFGEATPTETHDHCPSHGAAYFD